jgi:hypothetical protein
MDERRKGLKDVWNAFMREGATFTTNDIPICKTTATHTPKEVITWEEAKAIHKKRIARKQYDFKHPAFVSFYMDFTTRIECVHSVIGSRKMAFRLSTMFVGVQPKAIGTASTVLIPTA